MNILFLHTDLLQGGSAGQITSLAAASKKEGHDVTFLTYYNHPDYDFYADTLNRGNIRRIKFNSADKTSNESGKFQKLLFKVKSLLQIRSFIRKHSFDAVVSFLPEADFINICSAYPCKKWKVIIGERSADPNTPKEILIYRKFYRFADAVVTNSHKNWEIINKSKQLVTVNKQHVIYNGVDTIHFNFNNNENYTYRQDERIKIVILGRYTAAKNIDNLIEAVHVLANEDQKKLEISWYGNVQNNQSQILYDKALSKVKEYGLNGSILLNNHPTDSRDAIMRSDVVGLFSIFEGLPNAVCEGMACGKPIIMTNVSDARQFVRNGENGILIENTDALSISQGLSELLTLPTDRLQSMGKKSREIAEQLFDSDKAASQYINLFRGKR
jgi:glycosyltransferase involved in cell wall biosynthesis